jgi:hypothetical protein
MAAFAPPYDFYRSKKKPGERMATELGAGLPAHVNPKEWEPMTVSETSPELFVYEIPEEIAAQGFSHFKLVDPPRDASARAP